MRTRSIILLLMGFVAGAAAPAKAAGAADAHLEVDAGNPGIRMSKQLWGIFFEEINFAGDGGIYAELIRNRAFEDRRNPLSGWTARRCRESTGR